MTEHGRSTGDMAVKSYRTVPASKGDDDRRENSRFISTVRPVKTESEALEIDFADAL